MITPSTTPDHVADGSSLGRVPLVADVPLSDPSLDAFDLGVFANALCLVVDHARTATPLTMGAARGR
jgi:hypothetical protein